MSRSRVLFAVIFTLAANFVRADVAETTPEPNITQEIRKADPRLEMRISLRVPRATVGELLDQVRVQSGVSIHASETDGAADVSVCVACRDIPLGDVLNAIWSLVSYRGGLWEWECTPIKGGFSYLLRQPQGARQFRDKLRASVQQKFEQDVDLLIRVANAGTEDEKKAALISVYGSEDIGKIVGHGLTPEYLWNEMKIFGVAFKPEDRSRLLAKGGIIEANIDSVSEEGRSYINRRFDDITRGTQYIVNGVETAMPRPKQVYYEVRNYIGGTAPMLSTNTLGMPLAGGLPLELAIRDRLKKAWVLDSDQAASPLQLTRLERNKQGDGRLGLATVPEVPTLPLRMPRANVNLKDLIERIQEVADISGHPVFARLPEEEPRYQLRVPTGESLADYWKQTWNMPLMMKFREGQVLISTQEWLMQDPPISSADIKLIRERSKSSDFVPLEILSWMAAKMTKKQLARLADEFPVIRALIPAQGVLALLHMYPDIAEQAFKDRGAPLDAQTIKALQSLPSSPFNAQLVLPQARYFTLRKTEDLTQSPPVRQIDFIFTDADGKPLRGLMFQQKAQPLDAVEPLRTPPILIH